MRVPVCLFALLLASGAAAQTPPARDSRPAAPSGTATIRGRVLDAASGDPVPGALVRLIRRDAIAVPDAMRQTAATAHGSYAFERLADGEYIVVGGPAEMSATYLHHAFGALEPREAGGLLLAEPTVSLRDGEVRDDVHIRLRRALAIEGRVTDEFGDPLADVEVGVEPAGGASRPASASAVQSDDRGAFRLFGLAPGIYRVCARPRDWGPRPSSGTALRARQVRTCHPAAVVDADAVPIVLTQQDASAVLIQLQRSGTFTIAGRVVNASGAPATDARVSLTHSGGSSNTNAGAPEMRSGEFTIRGVPPGEYVLAAASGFSSDPFDREVREQAFHRVRVEGDLSGVVLTTSPGATLIGRLVADSDRSVPGALGVQIRSVNDPPAFYAGMPPSTRVHGDSTFELTRLYGAGGLTVTGLPQGWAVASVRLRGKDITDVPVEFTTTRRPDELVIVITDRTARLGVRAVDERGEPAPAAQVFLLPADSARQQLGVRLGPGALTGSSAELTAIAPGEYIVLAVPADEIRFARDTSILRRIAAHGQRVTLAAGEARTLDVRVTPLPQTGR